MNNKKNNKRLRNFATWGLCAGFLTLFNTPTYAFPTRERPSIEKTFSSNNIKNTVAITNTGSMFITKNNTIRVVGENKNYVLGCKEKYPKFETVFDTTGTGALEKIVKIECDEFKSRSIALNSDGLVFAWGGTSNLKVPKQVIGLENIIDADVQYGTILSLKEDGSIFETTINDSAPYFKTKKIATNTDITRIERCEKFYFGLSTKGELMMYDNNGDFKNVGINSVVDIAGTNDKCYILKNDGTVWFVSNNDLTPNRVEGSFDKGSFLTDIVSISDGTYTITATNSKGETFHVCDNRRWSGVDLAPKKIDGLHDIVASFAVKIDDKDSVVAIDKKGDYWVCGKNGNYQLGGTSLSDIKNPQILVFPEKPTKIEVPPNFFYNFSSLAQDEFLKGGETKQVSIELISDEVDSFDIYYAPFEKWDDRSTWTEIAKNVSINSLSPEKFTSTVKGADGSYLQGTRYVYNWQVPNEFLTHVRILLVPNYK